MLVSWNHLQTSYCKRNGCTSQASVWTDRGGKWTLSGSQGLYECTSQSTSMLNYLGSIHTAVASLPVSFSVTVGDLLVGKSLFTSFLLILGKRLSENVRDTLLSLVQTLSGRCPPAFTVSTQQPAQLKHTCFLFCTTSGLLLKWKDRKGERASTQLWDSELWSSSDEPWEFWTLLTQMIFTIQLKQWSAKRQNVFYCKPTEKKNAVWCWTCDKAVL